MQIELHLTKNSVMLGRLSSEQRPYMVNTTKWFLCALLALAGCHAGDPEPVATTRLLASRADVAVDASDSAYVRVVQQLYVGYFGRPADPAGLAFYTHAYHLAGAPTTLAGVSAAYPSNKAVQALVDSFSASQEALDLYPAGSYVGDDYTFVFAVYNNLFSRSPDTAGADYWAWRLNGHVITRGSAVLSIMAGAQGADADVVASKTDLALVFTSQLDSTGQASAYSGHVGNTIARAMLQNVAAAGQSGQQALAATTIDRLQMTQAGTVTESPGRPRRLALVGTNIQLAVNGALLQTFANVLASDLGNLRPQASAWTVDIVPAASTISGMRDLLKPYDAVILIGAVPFPTLDGTPFLEPYRVPRCPFEFRPGTDAVGGQPFLLGSNPVCRNGAMLSMLRGRSAATETADVAAKLQQIIAYHRASASANLAWDKAYQFIEAGWFGGTVFFDDVLRYWSPLPIYTSDKITYLMSGSADQRMKAFLGCIAGSNEMCVFNGHGSPDSLVFEGPGTPGEFYSAQSSTIGFGTLLQNRPKAKFISLVSCSTQNFSNDHSIGTELLAGGDALLTYGFTSVTLVTGEYEQKNIENRFSILSLGGTTFADAYADMISPENFQGDPFISMRPFPSGDRPRMVVDGKHYNDVNMVLPLDLPDSVGGMKSTRVLHIRNAGTKYLTLRMDTIPKPNTGVGYGTPSGGEIEYGFNAVFTMEGNVALSGTGIVHTIGPLQIMLAPGEQAALTYSLAPRVDANNQPKRRDVYTGQFIITSDDPSLARMVVEVRGTVR